MSKIRLLLIVLVGAAVLGACAPSQAPVMIQPVEQIASVGFDEAFSRVVSAINTEPYQSDTGGWVITNSNQVGGFITAELTGTRVEWLVARTPFVARISVSLAAKPDGTTLVGIGVNAEKEAVTLARHIRDALGLPEPLHGPTTD